MYTQMSDEFKKVATQEIKNELIEINKILDYCADDSHILKNAESIEKHIHKIKGLAPMMGQLGIGEIASLNSILLKHMMEGNDLDGTYDILSESNRFMKNAMHGFNSNNEELKQKIKTKYSKILD